MTQLLRMREHPNSSSSKKQNTTNITKFPNTPKTKPVKQVHALLTSFPEESITRVSRNQHQLHFQCQ